MTGCQIDLKGRAATAPAVLDAAIRPAPAESALETAVAAHRGELLGFAQRAMGDRSLAEEAVQETFLRAWRARARYHASIASVRSWLFAIERHVLIDLARARRRRAPHLVELDEDSLPAAADEVDQSLVAWHVQQAIARLSAIHRHVLVETYYRRRPGAEVAAELHIPEGTVRSRLFYALRALRSGLEDMGWNNP